LNERKISGSKVIIGSKNAEIYGAENIIFNKKYQKYKI
jgi:hypothetical protein